jgi:hypothetical protein
MSRQINLPGGEPAVGRPAPRGHSCGQVGGSRHIPAPPKHLQGRPASIELTRAERFWIQSRIQRLGAAADPLERRLLEKVRIDT